MIKREKINSVLVSIFSILTIITAILSILNYIDIDFMMLSLGFTQIFGGISQINLSYKMGSKGKREGNKNVGKFSFILGIVIISGVIIKRLVMYFTT